MHGVSPRHLLLTPRAILRVLLCSAYMYACIREKLWLNWPDIFKHFAHGVNLFSIWRRVPPLLDFISSFFIIIVFVSVIVSVVFVVIRSFTEPSWE